MTNQLLLKITQVIGAALCGFIFYGCAQNHDEPIRVGITPFSGYAFFYLAEEKGFLNEDGVNFELVDLGSLADVRKSYERRQVDVMTCTLMEHIAVRAYSKSRAQSFYIIDYSVGADRLLAREGIASVQDLKDKKVGFEPESVDVVMIHHALRSAGMKFEDIQAVLRPQSDLVRSFLKGELDAIETYPPFSIEIMESYPAATLFDSSKVPFAVADVLVADEEFIQKNAKKLTYLIRAFEKARKYAADHPEEARQFFLKYLGLSEMSYDKVFLGLEFVPTNEQLDRMSVHGDIETRTREAASIMEGHMPSSASTDMERMVSDVVLKQMASR